MFSKWKGRKASTEKRNASQSSLEEPENAPQKWNLGILGDRLTDEVPGSVILLSGATKRNEPLGLRHARARHSASSLPSPYGPPSRSHSQDSKHSRRSSKSRGPQKKRTADGKFVLEPQPDDSANDPLNWPKVRRDVALLSLGFYCMVGGGMTPLLAAGFNNVAATYHVSEPKVALTTGFYMLGLGLGSVVMSPTAILWGKRPVYLSAIILFLLTAVWCALSPNYASLVIARVVQGVAVSPVECLPSATVAEIFFLHERAYRLGIYTLLLLGGKNLIPLVSAAIIQSLGWRWVFWMVAIVVGLCFFLIFFSVPETFWDRTPTARERHHRTRKTHSRSSSKHRPHFGRHKSYDHHDETNQDIIEPVTPFSPVPAALHTHRRPKPAHVGFAPDPHREDAPELPGPDYFATVLAQDRPDSNVDVEKQSSTLANPRNHPVTSDSASAEHIDPDADSDARSEALSFVYTDHYRSAPPKSYIQSLRPINGRLVKDKWIKVMLRPFILFAYPAVLWSSMVYALAVGWLIVLSESVSTIYRTRDTYNFTALQVGLVYISPFVGGVLGTAVAGKVSDLIVRKMAKLNDGVYEPEFRLVMAIPITIATVIGLMGFGWSAQEHDAWIVPTVFFGVISFGCSLASTTAVTFVVDSYRQYAGEALVTLNFCKNVLHGFIFSLFFTKWLESDGSKNVFLAVGGIQSGCMLLSIPMYIFGKRALMWTVRKNLMEKF